MRTRNPFVTAVLAVLAASAAWSGGARAQERLRVVTTTETLAAIARDVGGDRVDVDSLSRGVEDPHFVIPTPTLMVKLNDADLFVETGLQLEPWVERVIDGARNSRIRPTGDGYVSAHEGVAALEVPAVVSRAAGDVHPYGNPHYWLDPTNGKFVAANIARGLAQVDPAHGDGYEARAASFAERIDAAMYGQELVDLLGADTLGSLQRAGQLLTFLQENEFDGRPLLESLGGWRRKMLPARGIRLVSYHRTFVYFARAFDVEIVGEIEPKPGISPTPAHLSQLRQTIRDQEVSSVIVESYYDIPKARAVAEEAGIPAIVLPTAVGGDSEATDYFRLFDRITDLILTAR